MDEGGPAWNDSLGKKQATTPPAMFAARTFQPRNDGVNSTEMNVSQAKAMFESISKSQEMLDNVVTRNSTQYVVFCCIFGFVIICQHSIF